MQRGALHADKFGRARNIAPKAVDLRDQVITLEHFTRLAQWQGHDVLVALRRNLWQHVADIGRQHIRRNGRIAASFGSRQDHQAFEGPRQGDWLAQAAVRLADAVVERPVAQVIDPRSLVGAVEDGGQPLLRQADEELARDLPVLQATEGAVCAD